MMEEAAVAEQQAATGGVFLTTDCEVLLWESIAEVDVDAEWLGEVGGHSSLGADMMDPLQPTFRSGLPRVEPLIQQRMSVEELVVSQGEGSKIETLQLLCAHGHQEAIGQLIKAHSEEFQNHLGTEDETGARPLGIALLNEQWTVAQLLLEHGARPQPSDARLACLDRSGATIKAVLSTDPVLDLSHGDDDEGNTALHLAAALQEPACLTHLLAHGAMQPGGNQGSLGLHNAEGCTPLHVAVTYGTDQSVKVLLDAGADPTMQADGKRGKSALQFAAIHRRMTSLRFLLEAVRQKELRSPKRQRTTA